MLGKVYSGLADLENETGGGAAAVRWEQVALGYSYQAGDPEDCAISHNNLANYLERQGRRPSPRPGPPPGRVHIWPADRSGASFSRHLSNLANSDLPPSPPAFAAVIAAVETIEGVRFAALFERLPRTAPDGDAALAAVWKLATEEKRRREEREQKQDAVLASLPESVRAAFELEGEEFSAALKAALAALPEEEADAVLQQLRDADLIGGSTGPDMEKLLEEFEPLLQAIVAAATDETRRAEVEPLVADREEKGWLLREPVRRIWAGERDAEVLTAGLDEQDTALVRRILELVQRSENQAAVLASLPESVRAAFDVEGDTFGATLAAALAELPEEEAEDIVHRLRDADLIGGAEDTGEERAEDKVEVLLQAIAAAASDETLRSEIEPVLAELQESGWMLTDAVHRIWAGGRDAAALTAGLDSRTRRWWAASWR